MLHCIVRNAFNAVSAKVSNIFEQLHIPRLENFLEITDSDDDSGGSWERPVPQYLRMFYNKAKGILEENEDTKL